MAIDQRNIDQVLSAFERSDWDEIHLVTEGIELHLSVVTDECSDKSRDVPVTSHTRPVTAGTGTAIPPTRTALPRDAAPTSPAPRADLVAAPRPGAEITAPSPGIFWRSPHPGAPPFVDLGHHVEADSTLCIVEVMKLMNHVSAQVAGTVVGILVGNGEQVELRQALFRIRPDGKLGC